MEILGHSQISVTMNTYAHVLPESQRQAVAGLADLFGTVSNEAQALGTSRETEVGNADEVPVA